MNKKLMNELKKDVDAVLYDKLKGLFTFEEAFWKLCGMIDVLIDCKVFLNWDEEDYREIVDYINNAKQSLFD